MRPKNDPQIIRTARELKTLDPDTWLVSLYEPENPELYGGPWVDYMGDIMIDPGTTLPAAVIATGEMVRAARKALEELE